MPTYVGYADDIEAIEADEHETIGQIISVMAKAGQLMRQRYGRSIRTSHAKAHALVRGELRVRADLPEELRQGLFSSPRSYPVLARLAHVPGELLDDRRVSTPRGMALKIFDVDGPMLEQHKGARTQDFVLDTGKTFIAGGLRSFLAQIATTEGAAPMPEVVKATVSTTARAGNAALQAIGLDSAKLDFFGHPFTHPLAESYYSQCPLRYGDYIAKLAVVPATEAMRALGQRAMELNDADGLRTVVTEFFRSNPVEFDVAIQLCTDVARMPVEDASVEWPESESPYRTVARLVLPPQDAWPFRAEAIEDVLLFSPAHSLASHRPLGAIMRARMRAYEVMGNARRAQNGRAATEPHDIDAALAPPSSGNRAAQQSHFVARHGHAMPAATPRALPDPVPVSLTVNGTRHDLHIAPWVSLLDLLRERMSLTGTKKGCDHGQCGACTVLIDGKRVNACLTLAVMKDGAEITTIEGLAQNGELHPMQQAFMRHDAFQCGYCTPGQICSAVALAEEGHARTADEIREWMSGNLCRCGAYVNIVAAIEDVLSQHDAERVKEAAE